MELKALPVVSGNYNLINYEDTYSNLIGKKQRKIFSWYETGRVNLAYEAIDRHAEGFRKNKVALYYHDGRKK